MRSDNLMDSYIIMGQLESCKREDSRLHAEQPPHRIEPHRFTVGVATLLPKMESTEPHPQAPSQYASVVQKLKNYDKNELARMLARSAPACGQCMSMQNGNSPSKRLHYPCEDRGTPLQKSKEMRQLGQLKTECMRIDTLKREYVQKSRRREKQVKGENQVHLHESIFTSTRIPSPPQPATRR